MIGGKQLLVIAASAALLAASVGIANHIGAPPVSQGGELAYVRNYEASDTETAADGERVTATYVAFTFDENNPQKDRVLRFDSRGRAADTTVFHKADLPDGTFDGLSFVAVDHIERGILLAEGPSACYAVLNGVNAGQAIFAKQDVEARYLATGHFDITQDGPQRVLVERDGHVYALEASGDGSLEVDGGNIHADLPAGSDLRGWITKEYPATTQVMTREFDHLQSGCPAAEPEPEPVPEPEPEGPDAAAGKEVVEQDNETVTFGIIAENVGDETAHNVTLLDELPEAEGEWFIGGADSEDCGLDNRTLTCDFGSLESGEGRSVTATGYIRGMCGPFENTASVDSDEDADDSNNEATAVADLGPCPEPDEPDAAVAKEVSDQDEETVTFTITTSSVGDIAADNVTMTDELPEVDGEWFIGGADSEDCELDGNSLTCVFGTLEPGEERVVTATGYVRGLCGELENTAEVSADEDGNPENDRSTATAFLPECPPEEEPDAAVNKTADQDDQAVVFTLAVESVGTGTVENVSLVDDLPVTGNSWIIGGADSEDCELDGNHLECAFGDLAEGESRSVTAKSYTDAIECGDEPIENVATISADNDGNPDNDSDNAFIEREACEEPEPEPQPDAAVDKEVTDQDEETVTFTIATSSVGDADATNVTMTDELPEVDGEWFIGGPDAEDCLLDGNSLTCEHGTLAPGEERAVTATGYIIGLCDELPNTAMVSADEDVNASNDEDTAVAQLEACPPPADAAVDKSADQTETAVTFTMIVTSVGEEAVTNVALFDEAPDIGRTWYLGGSDAEQCTLEGRSLECQFGDLAPGESREVTLKAYTDELACGSEPIENVASITADNDGNADNDSDNAFIEREPCADGGDGS